MICLKEACALVIDMCAGQLERPNIFATTIYMHVCCNIKFEGLFPMYDVYHDDMESCQFFK